MVFIINPNQQEPFTGENLCVYKGSLKNHSKGSILNGFQEGKWTSWYKSGQKKSELNYTNGLLDGDWLSWFEDGSPSGWRRDSSTGLENIFNGTKIFNHL